MAQGLGFRGSVSGFRFGVQEVQGSEFPFKDALNP